VPLVSEIDHRRRGASDSRRLASAATAYALAALCASPAHATDSESPVFELSGDSAKLAASFVAVDGHRHLNGVKRLAIVSFTVEFIDSRETRKGPPARGSANTQAVTADIAISPDPAQLKPVADTLYDLAVENWRAAGIDVLTPQALSALPGYADLASVLVTTPYRRKSTDEHGQRTAVVVAAHGLPAYGAAGRTPPQSSEVALAKHGEVALLSAHLVVDFLTLRNTDTRMFRKKPAVNYVEMIRPTETSYRLILPDGGVLKATLKEPVRAPESPVMLGVSADLPDEDSDDGSDESSQADKDSNKNKPTVERVAINASVYYDQALRYLSATQEMLLASFGVN
jgi:hypothetical protein